MMLRLSFVALVGLAACHSFAGFVSYREIFAHAGTNAPDYNNGQPTNGGTTSTIAWYLRRPNIVGHIIQSGTGNPINTTAAGAGIVQNLPAVNAGPQQGTQIAQGFSVVPNAGSGTSDVVPNGVAYISYTREHSLPLAIAERFSWYQGNHLATDAWRVAIEIDNGQWYVSDSSFTNNPVTSGGAFPTGGQFKQVLMNGAWRTLSFDGNLANNSGSLAIGGISTPTGNRITAFGLYTDSKNNNMRFDTFQIDAVPEPTALSAIAIGLVALVRRRSFKA